MAVQHPEIAGFVYEMFLRRRAFFQFRRSPLGDELTRRHDVGRTDKSWPGRRSADSPELTKRTFS